MPGFTIRDHGFSNQWPLVLSVRPQKSRLPLLVKRLCCEARFRAVLAKSCFDSLGGFFDQLHHILVGLGATLLDTKIVRAGLLKTVSADLSAAPENSQQMLAIRGCGQSGQGLPVLFVHRVSPC